MSLELLSPQRSATPWRITADPRMPEITCSARVNDYAGGTVSFAWTVTIDWRGQGTRTNARFAGTSMARNSEPTRWQVPFNNQFFGGDVTVTVEARTQQGQTYRASGSPCRILGTQPSETLIQVAVGNHPWYASRIARHESGLRQFDGSGNPVLNTLGDGGVGIMQITGANQTSEDVWNWRHNVATGLQLLRNQAQIARTFWDRQVSQFNTWNASHPNAQITPPDDVTYNGITFSFNPSGIQHSFMDAIAIKMFNGATAHFIVWDNVGQNAQSPRWRLNPLNNFGRNYVERVCQTAP